MKKIVLTGGPCAGKTTAMARVREYLTDLGFDVILVPEAATLVFDAMTRLPTTAPGYARNQAAILHAQLALEDAFSQVAGDRTIMICDRGALDNKVYNTAEGWAELERATGWTDPRLLSRYDAVIHLVSAADGAIGYYHLGGHRYETPTEAAVQDKATQAAWLGHPHHRIIDNTTDFDTKVKRVLAELSHILGVPAPLELERKFLLRAVHLDQVPNKAVSHIWQTYLATSTSRHGGEERVRARAYSDGTTMYTHTLKRATDTLGAREELERAITKKEYDVLLGRADPSLFPIAKTRVCVSDHNAVYEVDVYGGALKGLLILEVEVDDLAKPITFPDWAEVDHEVTGDSKYSNYALSHRISITSGWVKESLGR